jgi:ketosteroid isomerase-like protein
MNTDALTHPTVKAAIEALQNGDRKAWSALFQSDAELYDDGSPRSLKEFTGAFHSDQWGDFRTYFRFQLSPAGKINRLDIGQAT